MAVKIVQISSLIAGFFPDGSPNIYLFGLGEDGKMYSWKYDLGQWVPNWDTKPKKSTKKHH